MAERVHLKVERNAIGLSPEEKEERIKRAKIELMEGLLTRYPSDEYQGIAFSVEGVPLEVVDKKAMQYRREDGEWYWQGERVRSEQIFEMVKKGLFEVHLKAWIESDQGKKEIDHGQMGMWQCESCRCGTGAEIPGVAGQGRGTAGRKAGKRADAGEGATLCG